MNKLEQELRERTGVNDLINLKIKTTTEGRGLIDNIKEHMTQLIKEMCEADMDNESSQAYTNVRYDLKTARHNIQAQMLYLVRIKR